MKHLTGKETIHKATSENGIRYQTLLQKLICKYQARSLNKHQITRSTPGKYDGNQIDHVLVKKKKMKVLQNIRWYRGTSVNTNHHLVIAKLKE